MKKRILKYCIVVFVVYSVCDVQAQMPRYVISDLVSEITKVSYQFHFDSLNVNEGDSRKVQEGSIQSKDHDACRDYIFRCFIDFFGKNRTYVQYFDQNEFCGLSNVIGYKPGLDSACGFWIVCAHYDSNNNLQRNKRGVAGAPGANDNASGIAAMLEIARVISCITPDVGVLFAAWDMEEKYTNGKPTGSNHWLNSYLTEQHCDTCGWKYFTKHDVRGVLNFDMIGNPQKKSREHFIIDILNGTKEHNDFAEELSADCNEWLHEDTARFAGVIPYSDHYTFSCIGIPSVVFIESGYWQDPFYHTYLDNIENKENMNYRFAADIARSGLAVLLKRVVYDYINNDEGIVLYDISRIVNDELVKVFTCFGGLKQPLQPLGNIYSLSEGELYTILSYKKGAVQVRRLKAKKNGIQLPESRSIKSFNFNGFINSPFQR